MKLTDIKYPIFPIRSHYKIFNEDGIVYVSTHIADWVLDNTNLTGDTLAVRRFKIKNPYPLKTAIFTLAQLIVYKKAKNCSVFIDSLGKLFKYERLKRHKLVYKKVLKYHKDAYKVYFDAEGISTSIAVDMRTLNLYNDNDETLYLGLIYYMGGWLFYEATNIKKKDTWLKI